jgi:hypothetical protein
MCDFTKKSLLNQWLRNNKKTATQPSVIFVATPDLASFSVFDGTEVPERDDDPVYKYLAEVSVAVAIEGYEGVDVVELSLLDGRIFSAVSVKPDTPEGRTLEYVKAAACVGVFIPTKVVLDVIRAEYTEGGKS